MKSIKHSITQANEAIIYDCLRWELDAVSEHHIITNCEDVLFPRIHISLVVNIKDHIITGLLK